MNKYAEYVKEVLPPRDALEQLAEESAELAQACLKVIRAFQFSGSINRTPVTKNDAIDNLIEEARDVLGCMYVLNLMKDHELPGKVQEMQKWERWAKRLGYKEEEPDEETL